MTNRQIPGLEFSKILSFDLSIVKSESANHAAPIDVLSQKQKFLT